jgi:hypothetical protein
MYRGLLMAIALLTVEGCAPIPASWRLPPRLARAVRPRPPARPIPTAKLPPSPHAAPAAVLVERALHERGFRFGTDGTVGALHDYLAEKGRPVRPNQARPGDVVFFDLDGGGADHVGLVEGVDPDGRITFREQRDGEVRQSYVQPKDPSARRDAQGRVLNTFLRPKRPDDPPYLRYFAGELFFAVLRPERR